VRRAARGHRRAARGHRRAVIGAQRGASHRRAVSQQKKRARREIFFRTRDVRASCNVCQRVARKSSCDRCAPRAQKRAN
jgi:hypothetical protein